MNQENLPWSKINDFVLLLETSRTVDELFRNAVDSVGRLIPCDITALFLTDTDGPKWVLSDLGPFYQEAFNEYYRYRFPLVMEGLRTERVIDYDRVRDTEYARDFIRPTGNRYSLGIYGEGSVCLSVNRSRWSARFSEREVRVLELVHPHLNNVYRLLKGPRTKQDGPRETTAWKRILALLTPREREILGRVLERETAVTASRALGISRRTVEKHIANIYEKAQVSSRQGLFEKLGLTVPTRDET